MSRRSFLLLFTVFLPIVIAGTAYFFFFPDVWFVRKICELTGRAIRHKNTALLVANPFVRLLRFYGFDMIWAFSFTSASYLILGEGKRKLVAVLGIASATGIITELLQLLSVFPGTFDLWDIVVEIIGALLSALMIIICNRRIFRS